MVRGSSSIYPGEIALRSLPLNLALVLLQSQGNVPMGRGGEDGAHLLHSVVLTLLGLYFQHLCTPIMHGHQRASTPLIQHLSVLDS
jgi:hypothetical protein